MKGLRFQKRVSLPGGLRLNLSKSGIGFSAGVRGFRAGVNSKGRAYTSASLPGSGISVRRYASSTSSGPADGCRPEVLRSLIDAEKHNQKATSSEAQVAAYEQDLQKELLTLGSLDPRLDAVARLQTERRIENLRWLIRHKTYQVTIARNEIAKAHDLDEAIAKQTSYLAEPRKPVALPILCVWLIGLALLAVTFWALGHG